MGLVHATLVYIVRAEEILLMRRRKEPNLGWLSPPGGKLRDGEPASECAAREMLEETGLVARAMELRATVHHLGPAEDEQWMQYLFLVDAFEGELVRSGVEGDLDWYRIDDLKSGRLPIPPADPFFHPLVLGDAASSAGDPAHLRIVHAPDGSVDRVEAVEP